MQRILKYLIKIRDHGILYQGSRINHFDLIGYSDFAFDLKTRRSTNGYLFKLAGPVTWKSSRQDAVSLSTTEAGYIAASLASREIIWLKKFLKSNISSQILNIDVSIQQNYILITKVQLN